MRIDTVQTAIHRSRVWALPDPGLFARYLAVGVIKTAVDFAAFNVAIAGAAHPTTAHILLANTVGFIAAAWLSYALNTRYTFRSTPSRARFFRYLAVSLAGMAVYNGALLAAVELADPSGSMALNAVKVAALSASVLLNFVGFRWLVFNDK